MKATMALLLCGLGGLIMTGAVAPAAFAAAAEAEIPVMRVLIVQTPDAKAYAHALSEEEAELKKNGVTCTFRVWQAEFAGPEAGTVVVQLEFPSFAMLSRYLTTVRSLRPVPGAPSISTLRKVVSDSVYREVRGN